MPRQNPCVESWWEVPRKRSLKRGGGKNRIALDEVEWQPDGPHPNTDILAIDEALEDLAAEDPAKAALVQLKYFAGFSTEDAADVLGISRATACRYWTYARTWRTADSRIARVGEFREIFREAQD